jgi:xylulokinase
MSYLGIDIGTTGCKAGVFDGRGRLLALAYREYPVLAPEPGWAELDSARVIDACLDAIREAAAATDDPVAGVGVSSQGEAFTPVAKDGRLLGHAMVSSDARAAALVGPWSERFGAQRLYQITGHTPHPLFTLYKLLWLRQHQPDVFARADKFYCFEDLLHARLGLEPAIAWPLAGRTMLFDVRLHRWAPEILNELDLDAERLARPVASGTVVGTIPAAIARELGLPEGVKVVAGGHDQPCGALGAGVVTPGVAMYATGTVECICPAFESPILDDRLRQGNLCTYDYTLPAMYTTVLYSLTGGNLLQWFRNQWGQSEIREAEASGRNAYEVLLGAMADEPTDLLVLPYFTPSGTPYFDADLPGAILGLRMATTRGQVLRALLEGVAMEMRLNVDLLEQAGLAIDEFRAIGGGANSHVLTQLKADVLGRPITTLAVTEAGCLGVAMLACAAATGAPPRELVDTWVQTRDAVEPDPARAARYDKKFDQYKELYPALRTCWQRVVKSGRR